MWNKVSILTTLVIVTLTVGSSYSQQVGWAGCRQSSYGTGKSRPTSQQWGYIGQNMASYFTGSKPTLIWIVGTINNSGTCELEFSSDGKTYPNVSFKPLNGIDHEKELTYFDQNGIKVYLQVESGLADMGDLIDIVMGKYGKHSCVIGFGVDVEWYKANTSEKPNSSTQVPDQEVDAWDKKLKSYIPTAHLFLKHWDTKVLPPTFRNDVMYIDDSQGVKSIDELAKEFAGWGKKMFPSPVGFQYGYSQDYSWWKSMKNAPKEMGEAFAAKMENKEQKIGMFWVDFTLSKSEVSFLFEKPNTAISPTSASKIRPSLVVLPSATGSSVTIGYRTASHHPMVLFLTDVSGQTVFTSRLYEQQGTLIIPTANLASGTYFISASQAQASTTGMITLVNR